jgi:hypothetical protein
MGGRFNDDYYGVGVQEWEDERIPTIVRAKHATWIPTIAIVGWAAIGQFASDHGWRFWVGYAAGVYSVASLFVLLEEVNENVRYVRHQLRVFRDGIAATNGEIGRYKNPQNATAHDILDTLDRKWS